MNKKFWTEEEDKILKKYYHIMGTKVSSMLPGRTRHACMMRAYRLDIVVKVYIPWSHTEIQILKDNYPTIGSKVSTLLPNRTSVACIKKAKKLGLKYNG